MHREQNFLSRSWKAYLSVREESPRLVGGITCQEQTHGSQAARWRLFQGRGAGLRHRSKHHGRGRGVATLRDRCKDRRGEDARALGSARVTPAASRDSVCILTATASSRPSPIGRTTSGCSKLRSDAGEYVAGPSVAEPRLHAEPRDLVKLATGCAVRQSGWTAGCKSSAGRRLVSRVQ